MLACRYMAPELLASSDRYPSADIFSLGLTLYEACIACTPQHREVVAAGNSSLPTEGPLWHVLRDGEAPPPPDRGAALCSVILAAMHPETSERPLSEKILSLPEVLNISLKRGPNLLLDKAPKTVAPTTLARASSFLESMCTNSLQLSEAGNGTTSCGSRDKPEDDRAHTPTGPTNSSGTISFWQPLPLKKWPKDKEKERGQEKGDEKGKEKEKNTQGVCILSMSPIMEQTTPQAISSAVSHFDKKSIECSTSRECKSSNISNRDTCSTPILFLDSQSYYERSEWGTGPGPSPGELLDCQKDLTQRGGLRRSNASLSFPLPGSASSSRRRNKSYDITNNAQNSKSSFTFNLTSPSVFASNALSRSSPLIFSPIVSEGNSLTRTTPSPFSSTFPSATPNIAKHRYTDSNITSTYTTSSISVGNVFCSAGLGGYLPCSQSSMKPTGLTMRTVSKSIRRAGLETLTAGGERRNEKSA